MCERPFSPSSSASSQRLGIDAAPSGAPAIAPPWRRSCPCPLRSARRVSPRPRSAGARPRRRPPPKRSRRGRAVPERGRDGVGRRGLREQTLGAGTGYGDGARRCRVRTFSRRRAPSPPLAFPCDDRQCDPVPPSARGLILPNRPSRVERLESSSTPSRNRRPCAVGGPPIRPGRSLNSSATMPMRRCGCLDRRAVSPMLAGLLP
jgi:hypothetical protein